MTLGRLTPRIRGVAAVGCVTSNLRIVFLSFQSEIFVRPFSLAGERTRGLFCFVFEIYGTCLLPRPINLLFN